MDQERIFLSAVSGEFKAARETLARTLRGARLTVAEQSDFGADPNGETLLDKLNEYIKDCHCVVSLIGKTSGTKPTPDEASKHAGKLPRTIDPATCADWSYTQWEVFFALHHRPKLVTIQASDAYKPGSPDEQQAKFLACLKSRGTDLTTKAEDARDFEVQALRALYRGGVLHRPDNLPFPSIGTLFTGREDFLRDLRASLLREGGGASAIVSSVCGMGGIGKTRTAVEYAHRHHDAYTALLFVRAPDQRTLTDELAALTGVLRLPQATDTEQNRAAVLNWLADHRGWLLILDNVDTPDAVRAADTIVRTLRGGHVLLTSRLDDAFRHGIEPLELGLLTLDDAVAYLLKVTATRRRTEPDDTTQARVLAEALDRLTLALVHAGAYIAERRFSFARYLTEWNLRRDAVLGWAREDKTGYPLSLAQTWLTSMDQLTPAGKALLERLSFFANDPVPDFLLNVPLAGSETAEGLDPLLDLARYSLVTRDTAAEAFGVHRIVRDVTNRRLATDPAAHKHRLTEALGWVNAAFEGNSQDVRNWPRLTPLAPHAEIVARTADTAGIAAPTSRLMNELAVLFQAKAAHIRAEPLMRRALAINEASLGADHPAVATHLNNLALLLQATNRLTEAEPLYRRALAIDEASLGANHPDVATCLNNLAGLLRATNRPTEAEPLYRRALVIDEASLGADHPDVARDLNNLALLLRATNRLTEAEPLYRRALAIDEASLGADHPNVATRLNNLAGLLRASNRLAEAEPLYRRALAIDEASLGADHPNVARDLNNLALLLRATNRLAEAEPLYRRALAINEASLGADHPTVATGLNNLALLLQATLRLAEAEPLMRRALAIDEASLGADHPNTGSREWNLARLLQDTHRLEEAYTRLRRALIVFSTLVRAIGRSHPWQEQTESDYRVLLAAMGHDEAAIRTAVESARREAGLD